jgi:thioesterase domain-containing protein/acyl carrier protein
MPTDLDLHPDLRRRAPHGRPAYSRPDSDIEARLSGIWRTALGIDCVGPDDDFFALGGTSIQAAVIFDAIERETGYRLPLALLYEASTIRQLASRIAFAGAQPDSGRTSCIVPIETTADGVPLFVVPGIGGGVVGLAHLGRVLGSQWPVYALESRGLDGREAPLINMGDIAADFLAAIRSVQPGGPVRLFGICWGSIVALEMARQLAIRGESVGALVMMDPPPPGHSTLSVRADWQLKAALPRFVASRLGLYWRSMRALPPGERRAYARERLRTLRDIVRRRDIFRGDRSELFRRSVAVANATAARRYVPRPFAGNVHLIFTADRAEGRSRRSRSFWQELVGGRAPHLVPGRDTGEAISPDRVAHVAAILREVLCDEPAPGADDANRDRR